MKAWMHFAWRSDPCSVFQPVLDLESLLVPIQEDELVQNFVQIVPLQYDISKSVIKVRHFAVDLYAGYFIHFTTMPYQSTSIWLECQLMFSRDEIRGGHTWLKFC